MSSIAASGAYAYQKRRIVALEDAETRAQMGLDTDFQEPSEAEAGEALPDGADLGKTGPAGDERVLNAARAM